MGDNGFCEIADVSEFFCDAHVFECAGVIFGGEEVIAIFEAQSFADIFEGVGVGPADANRFFSEGEDWLFACVERVFCVNPRDLIREEVCADERFGVDVDERIYGAHGDG